MTATFGTLSRIVSAIMGEARSGWLLAGLQLDARLTGDDANSASRAHVAMALNALLFADLLDRVPSGAAYVSGIVGQGGAICFDHGALRTIDGETGALPSGHAAFGRLLEPLGYEVAGTYPLPKLNMTGYAYAHRDFPETIPQFFVSELHIARLPEEAQEAARRIFGASRDPLGSAEWALLDALANEGRCPTALVLAGLPGLVRAFGRHHAIPRLTDYEALLASSAEGAWIATEGNAFNHATDRVPDVTALSAELLSRGLPLKQHVEVSSNGRVRQTAFIADKVLREFHTEDGALIEQMVPGSFYEFITRDIDPANGGLDLTFDSGNATGIFRVTSAS